MADTLTPNIKLTNQTEGGNANTWGQIADDNFERIDDVMGDVTEIVTTGGDTPLVDDQELVLAIRVTGTLVTDATITFSGRGGFWIVANETDGEYKVTCRVGSGAEVEIEQGGAALIWCDGENIRLGNPPAAVIPEDTISSSSTTNILGSASEFIAITGTAEITSFGTGPNRKRFVRAAGEFKLKHNPTSLILPAGGNDIEVEIGDTFIVVSDESSNARVMSYQRASGRALIEEETPDLDAIEALQGKNGLLRKKDENEWELDPLTTNIIYVKDTGNANVPLPTGVLGDVQVDFDCVITGVTLLADKNGSAVIDIWKDTYANYPPTADDSICGAASKPTLSNASKYNDTSLPNWNKSINAGDIIRFNLQSVSSISRLTIKLRVQRYPANG